MSSCQRSSSRAEQLAVAKERRRLAELEAAAVAQKQLEEQKRERHRRLANRLFGQLETQRNEDGSVDFDIPNSWKPKASKGGDSKELKRAPRERSYQKYRTIWKNLYRPPLIRECCAVDEVPLCSCTPAEGCGDYCQNRLLFMECAVGNCNSIKAHNAVERATSSQSPRVAKRSTDDGSGSGSGSETSGDSDGSDSGSENGSDNDGGGDGGNNSAVACCKNTAMQMRKYPSLEVFKTSFCGFGLKVAEDVPANTVLIEYTGEVITASECNDRMAGMTETDDFYFASLGGGLMLDAKHAGSVARFANHCCDPSCELQKWSVVGEPRIALVTKAALTAGSEITYNYQYFDDGLDSVVNIKRQKCLCGAKNCSGTIGGRVTASDDDVWTAKAVNLLSGNKRYPLDAIKAHIDARVASIATAAVTAASSSATAAGKRKAIKKEEVQVSERKLPAIEVDCAELRALKALLVDAERWLMRKRMLFGESQKVQEGLSTARIGASSSAASTGISSDSSMVVSASNENGSLVRPLSIPTPLIEISTAESLLKSLPRGVKLEEAVQLDALIKKAHKTNRTILAVENHLNPSQRVVGAAASSLPHVSSTDSNTRGSDNGTGNDHTDGQSVRQCEGENALDEGVESTTLIASTVMMDMEDSERAVVVKSEGSVLADTAEGFAHTKLSKSPSGKSSSSSLGETNKSFIAETQTTQKNTQLARRVQWDEVMGVLKDVLSVAPLNCPRTPYLLRLLQQVNDWSYRYFGGVAANGLHATGFALPDMSMIVHAGGCGGSGGNSSCVDSRLSAKRKNKSAAEAGWVLIRRLNALYTDADTEFDTDAQVPTAVAGADTKRHDSADSTLATIVTGDSFAAEDFLETRLSLFMERRKQLDDGLQATAGIIVAEKASSSGATDHASTVDGDGLGDGSLITGKANKAERSKSSQKSTSCKSDATDEREEEDALHCFCCLPEDQGETLVLSQCDVCDSWYHPNCINAALVSVTATSSLSVFECPLCLHRRNRHSNFAYAPLSEWKFTPVRDTITKSAGAKGAASSSGAGKKATASGTSSSSHNPKKQPSSQSPSNGSSGGGKRAKTSPGMSAKASSSSSSSSSSRVSPKGSKGKSAKKKSGNSRVKNGNQSTASPASAKRIKKEEDAVGDDSAAAVAACDANSAEVAMNATLAAPAPDDSESLSNNNDGVGNEVNMGDVADSVGEKGKKRKRRPSAETAAETMAKKKAKRRRQAITLLKSRVCGPDPLDMGNMSAAIVAESQLQICQSPVALLLNLCNKYVAAWSGRVDEFFCRKDVYAIINTVQTTNTSTGSSALHHPHDTHKNGSTSDSSDMTVVVIDQFTLDLETSILNDCLKLYFELRLLRIKPVQKTILRSLAWLISARTVLRRTVDTPETSVAATAPAATDATDATDATLAATASAGENTEMDSQIVGPASTVLDSENGSATMTTNEKVPKKRNLAGRVLHRCTLAELALVIDGGQYAQDSLDSALAELSGHDSTNAKEGGGAATCARSLKIAVSHELQKLRQLYQVCEKTLQAAATYSLVFALDNLTEVTAVDSELQHYSELLHLADRFTFVRFKALMLTVQKKILKTSAPVNGVQNGAESSHTLKSIEDGASTTMEKQEPNEQVQEHQQCGSYCWCRGDDDGTPMVQCDGCDEWFHSRCIGITAQSKAKAKVKAASRKKTKAVAATAVSETEPTVEAEARQQSGENSSQINTNDEAVPVSVSFPADAPNETEIEADLVEVKSEIKSEQAMESVDEGDSEDPAMSSSAAAALVPVSDSKQRRASGVSKSARTTTATQSTKTKAAAVQRRAKGAIKTSKQLNQALSDNSFYCIMCCEERGEEYPFKWEDD